MDNLFTPVPELVFFIFFKKYIYIQSVTALSLLRLLVTRQNLDLFALLSFLLCLIALFCLFALPLLGIYDGFIATYARGWTIWAQGLGMLLVTSAPLFIGGFRHAVRWSWLDMLHGTLVGALVTLYWVAQLHG